MASDMESEIDEVVEEVEHIDDTSSSQSVANEEGTKKRSAVWIYFAKIHNSVGQPSTGYHVECKVCGKSIKTSKGNTTNLISHLKTTHSKKYEEVKWKTEERK